MSQKSEQEKSDTALKHIKSDEISYIIKTIRSIQLRLKDPDIIKLDYAHQYDKLSYEFNHFFENYYHFYLKVLRGENMATIATILFYKDKINQGLMTEESLSDALASKYFTPELKSKSDEKINEMKKIN